MGFDIRAFLDGAKEADQACKSDNIRENPALLNSVLKYLAGARHGRDLEVLMPYGGQPEIPVGMVYPASGRIPGQTARQTRSYRQFTAVRPSWLSVTTDMHAQTQEHQEGPKDKIVQFVSIRKWADDLIVPHMYDDYEKTGFL